MAAQLSIDQSIAEQASAVGHEIYGLIERLYPICRSITGPGLRASIAMLREIVPLEVDEVPSSTQVFDWTVPPEWRISEAYVEDPGGKRIVDFSRSNLSVVSYSTPIDTVMSLDELRPHLHSLPERPDWIPFRTSYYTPNWGFCLPDRVLQSLSAGKYRVVIRSSLAPGSLTLAEHLHRGATPDEVLIFAHTCHPSLCNDNLSGVAVATYLARFLSERPTRYSYRFVFAPATIGSIAWLARHEAELSRIRYGLVLSLLGDAGPFHYKLTRKGDHEIDRALRHVLLTQQREAKVLPFSPWGYDERQFASPGINLPVGRLTRTPNGEFAQYHTSADDLGYVSPEALGESWLTCLRAMEALENNVRYLNLSPKGEPQLGRRGLYRSTGGYQNIPERQFALLWVLNQSDGQTSLLEIAERSGLSMHLLASAANDLERAGLLQAISDRATEQGGQDGDGATTPS